MRTLTPPLNDEITPTIALEVGPAVASPADTRRRRWAWRLAAAGVVVFLAVLAYAETVWLHTSLPQDRVSRVTLIALPASASADAGRAGESLDQASLDQTSLDRLIASAADPTLLDEIGAKLDFRNPDTGEPVSLAQLGVSMRGGGQCIRVQTRSGRTVTGALLYNAVRGPDRSTTEAVARAWSQLFMERSAAELAGVSLQPAHTLEVPYEICR
ncbi:MAG: hypothetical protein HY329_08110 [Chloroflexi bacterium]|nr:hypothetical protein [Chloroflexota bacterium]